MLPEDINKRIIELLNSLEDYQEFADLASPEELWSKIDKTIPVPGHVALGGGDCPNCFDYIRVTFDKWSTNNYTLPLICPHCKSKIICKIEYTGYTSELYLEEDPDGE